MKGSKYLSELVDCSMFQKGKLNLIEAPTGCGKTYFALKHIPSFVKNPFYKVAFLIDTTNGKEQITPASFQDFSPGILLNSCGGRRGSFPFLLLRFPHAFAGFPALSALQAVSVHFQICRYG